MSTIAYLAHLFIPHQSNNQKAKVLHSGSLFYFAIIALGFQLLLTILPRTFPSVLGYAANISPNEVISLTNQERTAKGLTPLNENKVLSQAAIAKGNDMLAKGYWAHFAPDGTSPWSFFSGFGYKYQYAGENLARDFTNAGSAVVAWMNSPTHKENILNPHYREVGIGVVEGSLGGVDTTIVVQFFGTPLVSAPSIPIAKAEAVESKAEPTIPEVKKEEVREVSPATAQPASTSAVVSESKISPFVATKDLSLGLVGGLLLILSVDLIIVKRKRIIRMGGRTLAHIAYLSMILAVILLLKAGRII